MTIDAWPFLIGRSKHRGYRVVVAPEFLHGKTALAALQAAARGPATPPGTARLRAIEFADGQLSLVCRVFTAHLSDYGLDGAELFTDDLGRRIELTEGLVLRCDVRTSERLSIAPADLERAHAAVAGQFRQFWREEGTFRVGACAPLPVADRAAAARSRPAAARPPSGPAQASRRHRRLIRLTALAVAAGAAVCVGIIGPASSFFRQPAASTSPPPPAAASSHLIRSPAPQPRYLLRRHGLLTMTAGPIGYDLNSPGRGWGRSLAAGHPKDIQYVRNRGPRKFRLLVAGAVAVLPGPAGQWTRRACLRAAFSSHRGRYKVLSGPEITPGHALCLQVGPARQARGGYLALAKIKARGKNSLRLDLYVWQIEESQAQPSGAPLDLRGPALLDRADCCGLGREPAQSEFGGPAPDFAAEHHGSGPVAFPHR
jgi:hypothetical protein